MSPNEKLIERLIGLFWGLIWGALLVVLAISCAGCGGGGSDQGSFIPPTGPIDAQKCASMTLPKNGMDAQPCPVQGT